MSLLLLPDVHIAEQSERSLLLLPNIHIAEQSERSLLLLPNIHIAEQSETSLLLLPNIHIAEQSMRSLILPNIHVAEQSERLNRALPVAEALPGIEEGLEGGSKGNLIPMGEGLAEGQLVELSLCGKVQGCFCVLCPFGSFMFVGEMEERLLGLMMYAGEREGSFYAL